MSFSASAKKHRSDFGLIVNPSLRAPVYLGILIFVWTLTAFFLILGAVFIGQSGGAGIGVVFFAIAVVLGAGLPLLYSRNGIAVDEERVYRTVGDKRHSVERARVKRVLYRAGVGQLLDADGKAILIFGQSFTPRQIEALAEYIDRPYRRYQKPKK
jgi:hypothetical protein